MANYKPTSPPGDVPPEFSAYTDWILNELQKVADSVSERDFLQLVELSVAPTKPRVGMVALADGTNWNPGSGAGFYGYRGGAWHKFD